MCNGVRVAHSDKLGSCSLLHTAFLSLTAHCFAITVFHKLLCLFHTTAGTFFSLEHVWKETDCTQTAQPHTAKPFSEVGYITLLLYQAIVNRSVLP